MLHNVPTTINRLLRQTVLNHPNAWGGFVLRKRVTRLAPATVGGLPTLGGLAVLDSEDEEQITFGYMGNVSALLAEQFAAPAGMLDRRDANLGGAVDELRFLIEPEAEPETSGWFEVKTHDVLYLLMGADFEQSPKVAYEVVGVETTSNIPPFTTRYVCNRRAALDLYP